MPHGLDTDREVFCYEQEFYPLSNFSSFAITWKGLHFPTSEHAYQWEKFTEYEGWLRNLIQAAPSAHAAFKYAQERPELVRGDWYEVRVPIMHEILREKARQHEYVRKKLLETGDRIIVENSWRDDFWGWGPRRDGKNMLGRLWMEVRSELQEVGADA